MRKEVTRERQIAKFEERLRKKAEYEKTRMALKNPIPKRKNAIYICRTDGYPQIRIYHKKAAGKKSPRYLLKCGCCENKMEIWYDKEALEIAGVHGSIENWKEILLPLLKS